MPSKTNDQSVIADMMVHRADPDENEPMRAAGAQLAPLLPWLPRVPTSHIFERRSRQVRNKLLPILARVDASVRRTPLSEDARWLRDNASLVYSELATLHGDFKILRNLPHVRNSSAETLPRVLAFAHGYFRETEYHFQEQAFAAYCRGFQETSPLALFRNRY